MNTRIKINRKWIWRILPAMMLITFLLFACHVKFRDDPADIELLNETLSITAGDEITFNMTILIENYEAYTQDRVVLAVYVPKLWRAKDNTEITFICNDLFPEGEVKTMSWISDDESPSYYSGSTYGDALKLHVPEDPNIPGADMEWVAFVSDDAADIPANSKITLTDVKVKFKTSTDNVRCKIGFYTSNYQDALYPWDGLLDPTAFQGWIFTDCFETIDGDGAKADFCEMHYNLTTPGPGISTQNDIITFKYQGGVGENKNNLSEVDDIYINLIAYTKEGKEIPKKVKMTRENPYGKTYAITFWAEDFFEISRDEELVRIDYYYSDASGDQFVDLYDDEHKDDTSYIRPPGEPITPFEYDFKCSN